MSQNSLVGCLSIKIQEPCGACAANQLVQAEAGLKFGILRKDFFSWVINAVNGKGCLVLSKAGFSLAVRVVRTDSWTAKSGDSDR